MPYPPGTSRRTYAIDRPGPALRPARRGAPPDKTGLARPIESTAVERIHPAWRCALGAEAAEYGLERGLVQHLGQTPLPRCSDRGRHFASGAMTEAKAGPQDEVHRAVRRSVGGLWQVRGLQIPGVILAGGR